LKRATPSLLRSSGNTEFFSIDTTLHYEPFFSDFGPLNLGCTYRFCEMLSAKLEVARAGLLFALSFDRFAESQER